MRPSWLELMHDHVRAIHRAVTGDDPPPPRAPASEIALTLAEVTRHFALLESMARAVPDVAERVPPFASAPPLDLSGTERELVIELGVPGVNRDDVEAELEGDLLVISGARQMPSLQGRVYLHMELPRGPFRREVLLPAATVGRPRVEVDNGVVRVRVAKASKSPLPQA